LGGLDSWVSRLVGAWAWAWGLGVEVGRWRFEGMVVGVVVVGRSWDLVACRGVGMVLGEWDPVDLVEGLSMFADGIFLLRRCWRASGWLLAVMGMMVAEAGTCLRAAVAADRTIFVKVDFNSEEW
jgi:hypothetical protein